MRMLPCHMRPRRCVTLVLLGLAVAGFSLTVFLIARDRGSISFIASPISPPPVALLPPPVHSTACILAGRYFLKTLTGAAILHHPPVAFPPEVETTHGLGCSTPAWLLFSFDELRLAKLLRKPDAAPHNLLAVQDMPHAARPAEEGRKERGPGMTPEGLPPLLGSLTTAAATGPLPVANRAVSRCHSNLDVSVAGPKLMQRELYHAARAKPHAAPYYTFMLPSFAVPAEREALLVAAAQAPTAWWAIKPSRGTGGRGIRLARGAEELGTLGAEGSVVERFLSRPLLFEGRRFHIRLFIVVTAWRPLRAYVDGASARIFLARLPNTMFDPALPQTYITNANVNLAGYGHCDDLAAAAGLPPCNMSERVTRNAEEAWRGLASTPDMRRALEGAAVDAVVAQLMADPMTRGKDRWPPAALGEDGGSGLGCFEVWAADISYELEDTAENDGMSNNKRRAPAARPVLFEINNTPGLVSSALNGDDLLPRLNRALTKRVNCMATGLAIDNDARQPLEHALGKCMPAAQALGSIKPLAAVRLCREAFFAHTMVPVGYSRVETPSVGEAVGGQDWASVGRPEAILAVLRAEDQPAHTAPEQALLSCCRQAGARAGL